MRDKRRTILIDRNNTFITKFHPTLDLMDAWFNPRPNVAKFEPFWKKILAVIPAPQKAHYLLKRPRTGWNEPDFYQF